MTGLGRTLCMGALIALVSGAPPASAEVETVTFGTTAGHVRFL